LDQNNLQIHQEKGAHILGEFLQKNGATNELINNVIHLISKHEVGGDKNQNLLKDADSISFLENNADIFLSRFDRLGYANIKEKFDWMYERISDLKAKEIARPMYNKIIEQLNQRRK